LGMGRDRGLAFLMRFDAFYRGILCWIFDRVSLGKAADAAGESTISFIWRWVMIMIP
jgi:hypothetical protein